MTNLYKNLKISDTIFRIYNYLESLTEDYKEHLSCSQISDLRLIDVTFFRLLL